MLYYIIGFLFLILFIFYLYMLGNVILDIDKDIIIKFITGYLVYSFFIAIGGIIVQFFKLPWILFLSYMLLLIVMTIIYMIYKVKNNHIKLFNIEFKTFLTNNWFLFVIAAIAVIIMIAYLPYIWGNNCTDDGFYLTKIATIPYTSNPFATVPSTGLPNGIHGLDTYLLNTWELESSVYVYILKIPATLFTRFFMSGFNYFLFNCCVYSFAKRIFEYAKISIKPRHIQYVAIVTLLFMVSSEYLEYSLHFRLQDNWQFTSAMYFGSVNVRTMGVVLLLLPMLNVKKITLKKIITVAIVSLVLLSKSTLAIPVVGIVGIAYLFIFCIMKDKSNLKYVIVVTIVFIVLAVLLGNNKTINDWVVDIYFIYGLNSLIFWVPVIIVVIATIIFKNRLILQINLTIVTAFVLLLIDPINNVIEKMSVYDFIGGRVLATLMYILYILAVVYMLALISKLFSKKAILVDCFLVIVSVFLVCGTIYSATITTNNIKILYKTAWENNLFVPNSTIELGEELDRISNSYNEVINIVMPSGLRTNVGDHFPSALMRCYAPKVIEVTSTLRFGVSIESEFNGFALTDQQALDNFTLYPNADTLNQLVVMLNKYPINCVIVLSDAGEEYLQSIGYKKVSTIKDESSRYSYYVFLKMNK